MATETKTRKSKQYVSMYDPNAIQLTNDLMDAAGLAPNFCVALPSRIMTDPYLSISAKGLYGVLCCIYAQTDELKINTIVKLSNMGGTESFYRHRNELILAGYVDYETKRPVEYHVIDAGDHKEGTAAIAVQTRVMMDQFLSIRQKGFYAYLQSLPGDLPSVKEISDNLKVGQVFIYRSFHTLAYFSDKIPDRWQRKCAELQADSYRDCAEKNPSNFITNYISDYCRFHGDEAKVFDAGSYHPLQSILASAKEDEKVYIKNTIIDQANMVSDTSMQNRLLHLAESIA